MALLPVCFDPFSSFAGSCFFSDMAVLLAGEKRRMMGAGKTSADDWRAGIAVTQRAC